MHYEDSQAEIHKLVVGPMDNNVYVLRCKQTGEAVLLDAANEHEKLLELCRRARRAPGARDPRSLGPHPGRSGRPRRRLRGGGHRRRTPSMLPSYDFVLDDDAVIEVGPAASAHHRHPRAHRRARCASGWRDRRCSSAVTPCSRAARAPPASPAATSTASSGRSRTASSPPSRPTRWCCPGHGDDTTIGAEQPHLQEWIDRGW